jgi:peptidoglycan hydrolase-like protein with peptidoglycan-binding domain
VEYLAYSLMDSSYAKVTADSEFCLPEFKLRFNWHKYFKSAKLTFAIISSSLAILAQAQAGWAAYSGPGRYFVRTNGNCLNVRTGPSTYYRSVRCYSNGSQLPRVVGYRNGFARLSTGNYVAANWINTSSDGRYTNDRGIGDCPLGDCAPRDRLTPTRSTADNGIGGSVTLRRGSRGEAVRQLQTVLGNVPVTGYYGPLTETAVRNVQRRNGLLADGVAGSQTLSYLGLGNFATRPPVEYTPYPTTYYDDITLRPASRGEAVRQLQRVLGNVRVTGYYDTATERAVRNFQARRGLRPTGVADSETLSSLGLGTFATRPSVYDSQYPSANYGNSGTLTLRRGSRGEAVAELQRVLGNVRVTGYYDTATERAVRNFQASLGLRANGVAGPQTLSYLGLENMTTRSYYRDYPGYSGISVGGR